MNASNNKFPNQKIIHSNINNQFFYLLDMYHLITTEHHFHSPFEFKKSPSKHFIKLNILLRNKTFKTFMGDFSFELFDFENGMLIHKSNVFILIPLKHPIDICSEWLPISKETILNGYFKITFNKELLIDYEYTPY